MPDPQTSSDDLEIVFSCPITGQALRLVTSENCASFPGLFEEGGYLSENNQILYPIRDGFPLLVPSEAVRLDLSSDR